MKIKLGFAWTKVVDLETRNNDAENTIKLYSHNLANTLHEKFFSPASEASKSGTEMLSTPECSCQIHAQISRNTENLKE